MVYHSAINTLHAYKLSGTSYSFALWGLRLLFKLILEMMINASLKINNKKKAHSYFYSLHDMAIFTDILMLKPGAKISVLTKPNYLIAWLFKHHMPVSASTNEDKQMHELSPLVYHNTNIIAELLLCIQSFISFSHIKGQSTKEVCYNTSWSPTTDIMQ